MEAILSQDVLDTKAGMPSAHGHQISQLRVEAAGKSFRVLRKWQSGFSIDAKNAPELRGLVDLFDGDKQVGLFLVTDNRPVGSEMAYTIKRVSPIAQEAAQAFERSAGRPVVLITDALSDFQ